MFRTYKELILFIILIIKNLFNPFHIDRYKKKIYLSVSLAFFKCLWNYCRKQAIYQRYPYHSILKLIRMTETM